MSLVMFRYLHVHVHVQYLTLLSLHEVTSKNTCTCNTHVPTHMVDIIFEFCNASFSKQSMLTCVHVLPNT